MAYLLSPSTTALAATLAVAKITRTHKLEPISIASASSAAAVPTTGQIIPRNRP